MTTPSGAAPQPRGLLSSLAGALAALFSPKKTAGPQPSELGPKAVLPTALVAPTVSADVDALARTLWGEARGEGRAGIEAVAAVIVNRAYRAHAYVTSKGKDRHPLYGDGSLASACTANPGARYKQFSCWNEDDPNLPKMRAVTDSDPLFRACLEVARKAAAGVLADPTGGATHYFDPRVCTPAWSNGATLTLTLGHHRFYKDVP